jgi:hypothetical protein
MYNQRGKSAEGPMPESPSVPVHKKAATGSLYKNPIDCLIRTVRAEGPLALYKVLSLPRIPPNYRGFSPICGELHLTPFCISLIVVLTNRHRTLTFMEQVYFTFHLKLKFDCTDCAADQQVVFED